MFDVSNETLGLFGSRKLSEDLVNPKNGAKTTWGEEEVDLMEYMFYKNNGQSGGSVPKMEKLLSCACGILEVEPLDYSCSSMSDGCKVDHGSTVITTAGGAGTVTGGAVGTIPNTSIAPDGMMSNPMSTLQDHVQQLKVSAQV